jgi:hypothetical protein
MMDSAKLSLILDGLGISYSKTTDLSYITDSSLICLDLTNDGVQWYNQYQYDISFNMAGAASFIALKRTASWLASAPFGRPSKVSATEIKAEKDGFGMVSGAAEVVGRDVPRFANPKVGQIVYVAGGASKAAISSVTDLGDCLDIKLASELAWDSGNLYYRIPDPTESGLTLVEDASSKNQYILKKYLTSYPFDMYIGLDGIDGIEFDRANLSQAPFFSQYDPNAPIVSVPR